MTQRYLSRRFRIDDKRDRRAIRRMQRSLDSGGQPRVVPMLTDQCTGKPARVPAGEELYCWPYGWNEYTTFCDAFLNSAAYGADNTQFILEVWL